jgi:hypothetical protein
MEQFRLVRITITKKSVTIRRIAKVVAIAEARTYHVSRRH